MKRNGPGGPSGYFISVEKEKFRISYRETMGASGTQGVDIIIRKRIIIRQIELLFCIETIMFIKNFDNIFLSIECNFGFKSNYQKLIFKTDFFKNIVFVVEKLLKIFETYLENEQNAKVENIFLTILL